MVGCGYVEGCALRGRGDGGGLLARAGCCLPVGWGMVGCGLFGAHGTGIIGCCHGDRDASAVSSDLNPLR